MTKNYTLLHQILHDRPEHIFELHEKANDVLFASEEEKRREAARTLLEYDERMQVTKVVLVDGRIYLDADYKCHEKGKKPGHFYLADVMDEHAGIRPEIYGVTLRELSG